MKAVVNIALVAGAISLILGIISRLTVTPIPLSGGVEAQAFLQFANTCLLVAITFILLQTTKSK